jgi:amino acid transporter
MAVNTGPENIAATAAEHQTDLVFFLVGAHLPAAFVNLGYLLFLTSVFAALLAFQAAVSRYQFALGREGVLPALFGRTHPRTGAPLAGSITQSIIAIVVLSMYAVAGADPLVYLFAWMSTIGGLGVLILMWATSAAVIGFFARGRRRENVWRAYLAPFLSFLLLSVVLTATVIGFGELLQVDGDSIFQWLIPVLYLGTAFVGFCWAWFMRAARPEVYEQIGRGTEHKTSILADAGFPRPLHAADPVGAARSGYPY